MLKNEDQLPISEGETLSTSPNNYHPVTVTVKDTWGAISLSILSVVLLVGWIRAEARSRSLIAGLARTVAYRSPNAE